MGLKRLRLQAGGNILLISLRIMGWNAYHLRIVLFVLPQHREQTPVLTGIIMGESARQASRYKRSVIRPHIDGISHQKISPPLGLIQ